MGGRDFSISMIKYITLAAVKVKLQADFFCFVISAGYLVLSQKKP